MDFMQVKEMTPEELKERLDKGDRLQVIDVREQHEWDAGHIPQAVHIPLATIPEAMDRLDKNSPIVMVCRSGGRSHNAAAYVQQFGFDVYNMVGGMLAWPGEVAFD
jgi:rhodanese-related sulfurtransferase